MSQSPLSALSFAICDSQFCPLVKRMESFLSLAFRLTWAPACLPCYCFLSQQPQHLLLQSAHWVVLRSLRQFRQQAEDQLVLTVQMIVFTKFQQSEM